MSKIFQPAEIHHHGRKKRRADPESNAPLRVAIQNARAANLSKENIENAIKRASGTDASELTEVTYEAKVSTAPST